MRVLVTGFGGFLGSHLKRYFDLTSNQTPGGSLELIPWVQELDGDLLTPGTVGRKLEQSQPDSLLHLAWSQTGVSGYERSAENMRWLKATANAIDTCSDTGTRFIGLGSCVEGANYENTRYRSAKMAAFSYAKRVLPSQQLTWLRPHWIFSFEDRRPRLIAEWDRAMRRGDEFIPLQPDLALDFIAVEDVASALLLTLRAELVGEIDIASGYLTTIRTVLRLAAGSEPQPSESGGSEWIKSGASISHLLDNSWVPEHTKRLLGQPR